jgi:hypothetical protein
MRLRLCLCQSLTQIDSGHPEAVDGQQRVLPLTDADEAIL